MNSGRVQDESDILRNLFLYFIIDARYQSEIILFSHPLKE